MSGRDAFSGTSDWRLFRVSTGEKLLWLCVVDPELRTYVYIPDSERFHLNNGVYADFVWDHDLTYVPIGIGEARELISAHVGALPPELTSDQRTRYLTENAFGVEETFTQVERTN